MSDDRSREYGEGYADTRRDLVRRYGAETEWREKEIHEAARIGGLIRQARTRRVV